MKMNGWQRLWVLWSLVWAVILAVFLWYDVTPNISLKDIQENMPTESEKYLQDAGQGIDIPFERNSVDESKGLQVFEWPSAANAKNKSIFFLNSESGWEYKIQFIREEEKLLSVLQDIRTARWDAQVNKFKEYMPGLVILIFFSSIIFYLFGSLVAWVRRGFKRG